MSDMLSFQNCEGDILILPSDIMYIVYGFTCTARHQHSLPIERQGGEHVNSPTSHYLQYGATGKYTNPTYKESSQKLKARVDRMLL